MAIAPRSQPSMESVPEEQEHFNKTSPSHDQFGDRTAVVPNPQPPSESVAQEGKHSEQVGPFDRPSQTDFGESGMSLSDAEIEVDEKALHAMIMDYWRTVDLTKRPRRSPAVAPQEDVDSPQEMVIKFSWVPLSNWEMEKEAFAAVLGKYGVPLLLFSFAVLYPNGRMVTTEPFLKNIGPISIGSKPFRTVRLNNEPHVLVCSASLPVRRQLIDAPTPGALVEASCHGMIGHEELLEAGYLQRNVSEGNVLYLPEPEKCIETNKLFPDLEEFSGMIIDCDQATRWNEPGCVKSVRRSGTLPYISVHLLETWGRETIHTAIDNLEFNVWVVLRAVLRRLQREGAELSDLEKGWIQNFYEEDPKKLGSHKKGIMYAYSEHQDGYRLEGSRALLAFDPLFVEWFRISKDARMDVHRLRGQLLSSSSENVQDLLEELKNVSRRYYKLYVQTGLDIRSQLPVTWDWFKVALEQE